MESIKPYLSLVIIYLHYEADKSVFIPEVNCKGKLLVNFDYLEVPEISSLHQEIGRLVANHIYCYLITKNSIMSLKLLALFQGN